VVANIYVSKRRLTFSIESIFFIIAEDIELSRGIQMKVRKKIIQKNESFFLIVRFFFQVNSDDFVMVLRTDGRIVALSDEIEHHLGKSMVNNLRIFISHKT